MNQSRAVTIHKKGPYKDPNNYRIIAVTNTLIKIYEKYLYNRYKVRMTKQF